MPTKNNKYKTLFDNSPVAIIEVNYSPLLQLSKKLEAQTVTNVRQFLSENTDLVKQTYKKIKIVEVNNAAFVLFNVKTKSNLLARLVKVFTGAALDLLVEQFVSLLSGEKEFSGEIKVRLNERRTQDIFLRLAVCRKAQKPFSSVVISLMDITPWKELERQLRKRSQLDGLTKLYNHIAINARLEEELVRARRYGLSLSCIMIDLDHFKIVNDKFGHQRGDQVLKKVARMIKDCFRKADIVGRYGGDEFLVILPETKAQNAKIAANRIHRMFEQKIFKYQKLISFHISLSMGITGYPSKKVKSARDLVSMADKAMYMAKKAGRNRIGCIL